MKSTNSFSKFIAFLDRPFPEEENPLAFIRALIVISVFVTLFLYLLRPFNIGYAKGMVLKYSIIYGFITFFAGLVYNIILIYVFKVRKEGKGYTFAKWILQVIGLLLFIAFFNFLYLYFEFNVPWAGFTSMIWATVLVGIFPIVFIGSISMIKSEKRNNEIANDLNTKQENLTLNSHKEFASIFDIESDKIYFIESLQNYINIHYYTSDGINKKTERATLKYCEELIENSDLVKCHRSYIVNRSKIETVSGNAQGLKLKLHDLEFLVPVSRSYIPKFKA